MKCYFCHNETQNPKFCSRSCSASYNNAKYPKRSPIIRKCCRCKNKCKSNKSKYCSRECRNIHHRETKDKQILSNGFGDGHYHNNTIRKYMIKHHGNFCMICGQSGDDWNGKPITLIVDHIDGRSNNNKLDNLRIVCPNCDCQLSTYKAKNKGNSTRSYFIIQK